ncbi:hypothetical protein [Puia dinghuensis]|nr:hypothetical protein [Puia dinghuensis]
MERKLYDANLRMLEVELELAGFPDDVTWDLRQEMPWGWRERFLVEYETKAFGFSLKGVLYFQQLLVNDAYRFSSFDVALVGEVNALTVKCSFPRVKGYSVGLREAINLMHGRPVFRDYRFDPLQQGYWLELRQKTDKGEFTLARNRSTFNTHAALDDALFGKRLGAADRNVLADQLDLGDRAKMHLVGKDFFMEVDLAHERLVLTNVQGKPAKINWWDVFLKRK